jgi:hypothetical protein
MELFEVLDDQTPGYSLEQKVQLYIDRHTLELRHQLIVLTTAKRGNLLTNNWKRNSLCPYGATNHLRGFER